MLNRLLKGVLILGVYLLALLQCCIIGWAIGSVISSLVLTVWSFVAPFPVFFVSHYWLLPLVAGLPFALSAFVFILAKRD